MEHGALLKPREKQMLWWTLWDVAQTLQDEGESRKAILLEVTLALNENELEQMFKGVLEA